jgi:hypothetical protein
MRRRLSAIPSPVLAGALGFLMAFGLYGATTTQLTGYEPETAAVTEGLVLEGHFYETERPPFEGQGVPGRDGHLYARAGLLQPVLEAPFFAAGRAAEHLFGPAGTTPLGWLFMWFYNPLMAALAAVALFALVFLTRRSLGWAIGIAALFVACSIAWPYSSIGMETTFMFALLASFACAAWARQSPRALTWALTGLAAGAAVATKPYACLTLPALAILLWPGLRVRPRGDQAKLVLSFALPLLLWVVAIGVYNAARFDGPTNFGYSSASLTVALPLNFMGLLISPGKGLIFYSPLVMLGALGLGRLWREDRTLAASLALLFLSITAFSGASTFWGDEVWGPRYIVPVAWALLVPIAWWADSLVRRRALVIVAAVALVVQVVAVSASYTRYLTVVKELSGVAVYGERGGIPPEEIPYGDDPPRWIAQLSPLLLQAEGLASSQIVERLGGDGIIATYHPLEGRERSLNLSRPDIRISGDFWWHRSIDGFGADLAALLFLLASGGSGYCLYRLARKGGRAHLDRAGDA